MTPRWHDGALDAVMPDDRPLVWSVAANHPVALDALARVPATGEDFADAALAPGDGGWRLLRRRLARALIARMAGTPADVVRLSRSEAGAPVVVMPAGWHVGTAGREGDMLIGVARRPIAVDREPLDDAAPLRDMLTPAERRAMDGLPDADRPLDWLRRWTMKEAHAKLIGEPLRIAPEAIETRIIDASDATAVFEGQSHCWTRRTATALETVAMWA